MLYAVFLNNSNESLSTQGALLELSWAETKQRGALVALSPWMATTQLSGQRVAQYCLPLRSRDYDRSSQSNLAKAVLDWVFSAKPQGSVLLLNEICVLRAPFQRSARPGRPYASHGATTQLQSQAGTAIELLRDFSCLSDYCSPPNLKVQAIEFPILISAVDLRKIAARWLQLCDIVSKEMVWSSTVSRDALRIAAAEYGIVFQIDELAVETIEQNVSHEDIATPLVQLNKPVLSAEGDVIFSINSHTNEFYLRDDCAAATDDGRWVIAITRQVFKREPKDINLRPMHKCGVKQGWVLDRAVLLRSSDEAKIWLDRNAFEIWSYCDGNRRIGDICAQLAGVYGGHAEDYAEKVKQVVGNLTAAGFLWPA